MKPSSLRDLKKLGTKTKEHEDENLFLSLYLPEIQLLNHKLFR